MKRNICVAACILVLFSGKVLAFTPNIHEDICQDSISKITRTIDGKEFSFTEKAIAEIKEANKNTDKSLNFPGNAFTSYKHFDGEEFSGASSHLINMRRDVIAKITASNPDGQKARKSLGTALHTLQDFYAHSNWVEIGQRGINSDLGRSVMPDPPSTTAFCPSNREVLSGAGLTELTSGYYVGICGCGPTPAGKCTHGEYCRGSGCDGINKDDPDRDNYGYARTFANKGTDDYLKQILDDSGVTDNIKAIKALMRINGTLGFVVDNTSSMETALDQIKEGVRKIVENYEGKETEPDEYLLVKFGDPDVFAPYTTTDADRYLSEINAIIPTGGGDCPEYSQSGLLAAIRASRNNSNLYLFTDANAKDGVLANSVSAAAKDKGIKITAFLTGICSLVISPAYHKNTDETGGQLFVLGPDELDQIFDLVRPQLSGDFVTIARTKGTFDDASKLLAAPIDSAVGTAVCSASIDSTVKTAVFSATMDTKGAVTLTRPNGNLVQEGDSGVTITELSNSTIITVNGPELGEWKLSSSGSGNFTMSAQANSPLDIYTFKFVELYELARGYWPIAGQPVVNTTPVVQSRLIGQYQSAAFRFVDESGATIQSLSLTKGYPLMASDEFAGSVTLPDMPFRVAVSGTDEAGNHYERLYPTLFRAQTVKVSLDAATEFANLPVGVTTTLRFKVENLGDSTAEFRMNAVDSKSFITRTAPEELTLASGESAFFEVDLLPPKHIESNVDVSLIVTATNTSDTDVTNSAIVELLTVSDYRKTFFPIVLSGKFFFIPTLKSNIAYSALRTVTSLTGRVWMDRNLGASRAATSMTDAQAYGDLYQWGRLADGHQKRTSGITATLSSTDVPGHSNFIISTSDPNDWRNPPNDNLWQGVNGINNPCPAGFRVPTADEWQEEINSWNSKDAAGAFASPLKMVLAGSRSFYYGTLRDTGEWGIYWSSTANGSYARLGADVAEVTTVMNPIHANGESVRCIRD